MARLESALLTICFTSQWQADVDTVLPQTLSQILMAASIGHEPQQCRFTLQLDGHSAELDYVLERGCMVIVHTGVPTPINGRGLGAQLVAAALKYAQSQGMKVVPSCSYAAVFIQRHPQYAALLG